MRKAYRAMLLVAVITAIALGMMQSKAEVTESMANQGTDFYLSGSESVANGTLIFTNAYTYPFRLASVMLNLPAASTNLTAITVTRSTEVIQYKGDEVVTNDFGFVETNHYHNITNVTTTTWTNTLLATSGISNQVTVVYDIDDELPAYFYILNGDVVKMTFSYTNAPIRAIWLGLR